MKNLFIFISYSIAYLLLNCYIFVILSDRGITFTHWSKQDSIIMWVFTTIFLFAGIHSYNKEKKINESK